MQASQISVRCRQWFARPDTRRLARRIGWTLLAGYLAFAALVLTLRYGVLPRIDTYRADIVAAASRALKQPVAIGAIEAGWNGLRPRLLLRDVAVSDAEGRRALGLDTVEVEAAWSSLWHFGLRLHRIEIVGPVLEVRRDAAGRLFVAGLEIDVQPSAEDDFSDWLLAQDHVVVRDAELRWHDERRAAPPLVLRKLNFDLANSGSRHRFGLTAEPPAQLAARLDVRGDFKGKDLDRLDEWSGEAYAELDYADLAGWRAWVDYPVDLPRGSGGMRLWLGIERRELKSVTADVRLADVQLRAGRGLPLLDLTELDGRLAARRSANGFVLEARKLALATRNGVRIAPTDASLRFEPAAANRAASGEFSANGLDLGALAALAAHLPFDDVTRRRLAAFAPRGRIDNFNLAWSGTPGELKTWRVKGGFTELGLVAQGNLPGFVGLSGSIEGDQTGGSINLAGQRAAIELPRVFAEPRLNLETLTAQATWQAQGNGVDVQLARLRFHNADAAGEAAGSYRYDPDGPGVIDLSAKLTRGSGSAVWRYMPLAVNRSVRDWLHASIVGGEADETTLRLKGDLAKFPFRDGKEGTFQVKGRFKGATLNYADGWPGIDNIQGELLFEGVRMVITGHRGSILGVAVGPVTAEIPDLEVHDEILTVQGRAAGATADFLRFIEASPVGARIDHFTEDMQAAGNGELQLKLVMPLQRIAESRTEGRYRFTNNQLVPDPALPPLTEVNGELRFTADKLEATKVRAAIFGAPMTVDIATLGDGQVGVKASGTVSAATLRQQLDHPALTHLSGSTTWNGTVKVRRKDADLVVESDLVGLASSLPEPFNKTTNSALPLRLERHAAGSGRDQLAAKLGDAFTLQLARRLDKEGGHIERGSIAVGGAAVKSPERGIALGVKARRLDVDAWRRLSDGNGGATLPLTQLELRTDELVAFGRVLPALRLSAVQAGKVWKAELKSREASGQVEWHGEGAGRIVGRLTQLTIPDSPPPQTGGESTADMPREMPAIDLAVDHFVMRGKEFGELKLKAENASDGTWNAHLDLRNDEGALTGNGSWRPSPTAPETRLDFKLSAKSIEKLLVRLGYPEAVRRGTATLEGALNWQGAPFAIDYPSLSGKLNFEARDGQFNKLEPGVGRLLGILSLQALPRRLILDFRDVFSEGFAFDGIAGQSTVTRGMLETKDLQIAGPAAKVLMSGTANLAAETQNLRVRIQPTIGDSVATGVLLAHPATGVTTWIVNKIFGNPLDQAFAFEYGVTGSWADPKVEKLSSPAARQTETAKPETRP